MKGPEQGQKGDVDSVTPTSEEQGQGRGVCQGRRAAAKVGPVRVYEAKGVREQGPGSGLTEAGRGQGSLPLPQAGPEASCPSSDPGTGTLRTQERQPSFY